MSRDVNEIFLQLATRKSNEFRLLTFINIYANMYRSL